MGKAIQAFEGLKQSLIDSEARGDAAMSARLRQRLNSMAVTLAAKYPQLEVGGLDSGWPYVKPRGQSSTSPPAIETVETLPGGIRLTTLGVSMSRAEAKARLMANGYSDAEAEQELNRLGVR